MDENGDGAASVERIKTCHRSIGHNETPCLQERCPMWTKLSNGASVCMDVHLASAQLNQIVMMRALAEQARPQIGIDPRILWGKH